MIVQKQYLLIFISLIVSTNAYTQTTSNKMTVPLGGNSWLTVKSKNGNEKLTDSGWQN